jgi:ribosomal protein L32
MLEYAKDISAPVGYQLSLRVKCVLAKGVQQDSNSVATLCEEWTTHSKNHPSSGQCVRVLKYCLKKAFNRSYTISENPFDEYISKQFDTVIITAFQRHSPTPVEEGDDVMFRVSEQRCFNQSVVEVLKGCSGPLQSSDEVLACNNEFPTAGVIVGTLLAAIFGGLAIGVAVILAVVIKKCRHPGYEPIPGSDKPRANMLKASTASLPRLSNSKQNSVAGSIEALLSHSNSLNDVHHNGRDPDTHEEAQNLIAVDIEPKMLNQERFTPKTDDFKGPPLEPGVPVFMKTKSKKRSRRYRHGGDETHAVSYPPSSSSDEYRPHVVSADGARHQRTQKESGRPKRAMSTDSLYVFTLDKTSSSSNSDSQPTSMETKDSTESKSSNKDDSASHTD